MNDPWFSPTLPRGTRIEVGVVGTMQQILDGPSRVTDGSENLIGAVRDSVPVGAVSTIPDGILSSAFFGYLGAAAFRANVGGMSAVAAGVHGGTGFAFEGAGAG